MSQRFLLIGAKHSLVVVRSNAHFKGDTPSVAEELMENPRPRNLLINPSESQTRQATPCGLHILSAGTTEERSVL